MPVGPVTNNPSTQPENRTYFPALDGLRGLAFLLVFLEHYITLPWGWAGVNIFFVLSGFLITGILYDSRDDMYRVRNFYVRRTLRIFPLYYALFFLLFFSNLWLHWNWSALWFAWPLYCANFLRFLSPSSLVEGTRLEIAADAQIWSRHLWSIPLRMGHLWSLCAEEQFYLLWPWVIFRVRSHRALLRICAFSVVSVVVLRFMAEGIAPEWLLQNGLLYSAPGFQLDALILGSLLALLWRSPYRRQMQSVARIVAVSGVVASIFFLAHTVDLSNPHWCRDYVYPRYFYSAGIPLLNFLAAAILVCSLQPNDVGYRIFNQSHLRWIGRISYGAYVFHDIFHGFYERIIEHVGRHFPTHGHEKIFTVILAFAGTLSLAWLSFRFFESPFLKLKERWTVRSSHSQPAQ